MCAQRRHVFSPEKTIELWAEGNFNSTELKLSEVCKTKTYVFEFLPTLCRIRGKRLWFSGRTRPCQG